MDNKIIGYLLYRHVDDYEIPTLEGVFEDKYDVVVKMNNLHMIRVDHWGFKYYSLKDNKFYSVTELRTGNGYSDKMETKIEDIEFTDGWKTPSKLLFK